MFIGKDTDQTHDVLTERKTTGSYRNQLKGVADWVGLSAN